MPDLTPACYQQVVGVDVGQRYLATVATIATITNCTQFFPGKEIRTNADHYARLRERLQQKGTRAATRKLVQIAGRERRLKLNANHVLSKRILDAQFPALFGLEDLNGIRERIKRKKGKKATKRQRTANRHASSWACAALHGFLIYKAPFAGSRCVKIEAHYTSQMCPRCGFTSQENRPEKGLLFVCQACQYTLHADLVGARNIALRTLLVRQD